VGMRAQVALVPRSRKWTKSFRVPDVFCHLVLILPGVELFLSYSGLFFYIVCSILNSLHTKSREIYISLKDVLTFQNI